MITPQIVDYDPNEFDMHPIDEWRPEPGASIDYWMNFTIGPDSESGHNYQVRVASPDALLSGGATACRHVVLVPTETYAFSQVVEAVERVLQACTRATFEEASVALSQYFRWEFEDHKLVDDDGNEIG